MHAVQGKVGREADTEAFVEHGDGVDRARTGDLLDTTVMCPRHIGQLVDQHRPGNDREESTVTLYCQV